MHIDEHDQLNPSGTATLFLFFGEFQESSDYTTFLHIDTQNRILRCIEWVLETFAPEFKRKLKPDTLSTQAPGWTVLENPNRAGIITNIRLFYVQSSSMHKAINLMRTLGVCLEHILGMIAYGCSIFVTDALEPKGAISKSNCDTGSCSTSTGAMERPRKSRRLR